MLATYRTFPEQDQEQVSVIFHMFADLELQQNCREEALKILVSISNDKPYGKGIITCVIFFSLNSHDAYSTSKDPALPITNTQILKAQKVYSRETKTSTKSMLILLSSSIMSKRQRSCRCFLVLSKSQDLLFITLLA